jgi:hypothetical protein
MVTPLDGVEQQQLPQQAVEIEDVGEVDVSGVEQDAPVDNINDASVDVQPEAPIATAPVATAPPVEEPMVVPTPQPQVGPEAVDELMKRRQADSQRQWEQQVLQRARQLEQRAQEQGTDPQSARQVARQYVAHQKELRDQESKAMDLVGFVEGRSNAAMHFAQKHKLVNKQALEDIQTLLKFRTPQEMELEARRMAQLRSQAAEIAQLKQGRVAPQTFDNSQGAAEATSNDQRLLDAYNNGDRSDAAVRAARRLAFGS